MARWIIRHVGCGADLAIHVCHGEGNSSDNDMNPLPPTAGSQLHQPMTAYAKLTGMVSYCQSQKVRIVQTGHCRSPPTAPENAPLNPTLCGQPQSAMMPQLQYRRSSKGSSHNAVAGGRAESCYHPLDPEVASCLPSASTRPQRRSLPEVHGPPYPEPLPRPFQHRGHCDLMASVVFSRAGS